MDKEKLKEWAYCSAKLKVAMKPSKGVSICEKRALRSWRRIK
jgi:hypothetical protein